MNRATTIQTLENSITTLQQKLADLKARPYKKITDAQCESAARQTPDSTLLIASWNELYSARDSGNPAELMQALDKHCQLFRKGFQAEARERAQEILAKRWAA